MTKLDPSTARSVATLHEKIVTHLEQVGMGPPDGSEISAAVELIAEAKDVITGLAVSTHEDPPGDLLARVNDILEIVDPPDAFELGDIYETLCDTRDFLAGKIARR